MVMAVSGLEWSERLTQRLQRLQSHGPVSSERGNLGQGRGTEEESTLHTLQNAQCGGIVKYQVRLVNM